MEKRGRAKRLVSIALTGIVLLVVIHTVGSLVYDQTQEGLKPGISGNSVFSDVVQNYQQMNSRTRILIAGEWLIVIAIVLYFLVKGKMVAGKEAKVGKNITSQKRQAQYTKSRSETDLDVLHHILQEKKVLRIETIAQIFEIDQKTAMDWSRILEEANFATIQYPTVGSPKVMVKHEGKKPEKEDTKMKKGAKH